MSELLRVWKRKQNVGATEKLKVYQITRLQSNTKHASFSVPKMWEFKQFGSVVLKVT